MYSAPDQPAVELAQSSKSSSRLPVELADVALVHEVAYPYSTRPEGVSVTDSRYWFDQIDRLNSVYGIGPST